MNGTERGGEQPPVTEEPKALVTERQIATLAHVIGDLEAKIDKLNATVESLKAEMQK